MMRRFLILLAFAVSSLLTASLAHADAIDGKWCDGARQIMIDGPTITLPSGRQHQGGYTRHTFDFVVPEGEEGAGERLSMVVQSDELMHLQRTATGDAQPQPTEAWRRCANIS